MTAEFPALAAQNASLLRAIADGPAASPTELAERAGILRSNINRKLEALLAEGLLAKAGDASHQVELTEAARRALQAIAVFEQGGLALPADAAAVIRVDPDLIDANPFQPRTSYDEQADEEMAQSVADKDVLQPILLRPTAGGRYQQALGHRRVRGARLAKQRGWLAPEYGVPAQVRQLSDEDMEEIALVENVQRSDLHWMDEAEAYLRLANRGKSANDIKRLVGEKGRSKRSIQELIQYARELDDDAKRKARLPEGDPDRLSYEQCRFLVGNKKPKPALELSAKAGCYLLELLDAGEADEGDTEVSVRLHARPTSRELVTLGDKGLVRYRFEGATPVAVVQIGEQVAKWLDEVGFHEDREGCLFKARADVVGEMAAGAMAVDNTYATPELNQPEEEPEPAPAPADSSVQPAQPSPAPAAAGSLFAEPQPPAEAEEEPEHIVLKPAHALAVTELAHKIQRHGQQRGANRAVEVGAYHRDPLSQDLVYARLVMFMPMGAANAAALTPHAAAWLDQQGVPRDEAGAHQVADETLLYVQAQAGHAPAGLYVTEWLNTEADAPPAPTPGPRGEGAPPDDSFSQQLRQLAREQAAEAEAPEAEASPAGPNLRDPVQLLARYREVRAMADRGDGMATSEDALDLMKHVPDAMADTIEALLGQVATTKAALQRLSAAGREAKHLIEAARSRTRLKPEEIAPVLELVERALTEADTALNLEPHHAQA